MNLRKFKPEEHYETLRSWFSSYEWTAPELDQLSEESWIIYIGDKPIAFSCFAKTDSSLAIMGPTISVKEKVEGKSECLDKLLTHLQDRAKLLGFKYMHYYTDHPGMVSRMEKLGMTVTDNANAYILLKSLGGSNTAFYDE